MAMSTKEFESIKEKIEALKKKRAMTEGALEAEVSSWKKTYGVDDIGQLQQLLQDKETELDKVDTRIAAYEEELKGLTNWALI